jgi:hypothetical protein
MSSTDEHVEAVESGQNKKRSTVSSAFVEPQAFMVQVIPFVGLDAEEERAEQHGDKKPENPLFAFFHRHLGKVVGEAARYEENRVDTREQNRKFRILR